MKASRESREQSPEIPISCAGMRVGPAVLGVGEWEEAAGG